MRFADSTWRIARAEPKRPRPAVGMSPSREVEDLSGASSIGKALRWPWTSTIAPLPRCHLTCDARSLRISRRSRPMRLNPIPTDIRP